MKVNITTNFVKKNDEFGDTKCMLSDKIRAVNF
jgi:hypothetical protein